MRRHADWGSLPVLFQEKTEEKTLLLQLAETAVEVTKAGTAAQGRTASFPSGKASQQ